MKDQAETHGTQEPRVFCLSWDPQSAVVAVITGACVRLLPADSKRMQETIDVVLPDNLSVGCWHPDGAALAVGTLDAVITVFNISKPSVQSRLQLGAVGDVTSLVFSRDGRYLVAGTSFGWVVTLRVDGLTPIRKIQRGKAITSIAWGDASSFFVSSIGEDVATFDVGDGALIRTFTPRSVYSMGRLRADGVLPVSNGRDVFLIDIQRGGATRFIEVGSIVGMDSDLFNTIVLQDQSGLVQVYRKSRKVLTLRSQRRGDGGWMGGLSVSSDGKLIAYIDQRGTVVVHRIRRLVPASVSFASAALSGCFGFAWRFAASLGKRIFWRPSNRVGVDEVEGELREVYSGLMGSKVIWTAVFSFFPILAAHVWASVKVTVSPGTALCLIYHGLGAYVWFHYRHLSGVEFRRESKERLLRRLSRCHFVLGILSYPVLAVVVLIWSTQIGITFFGLHFVSFPTWVAEFLGIEG